MRSASFDPAVGKPNAFAVWEDGILIESGKTHETIEIAVIIGSCDIVYIEDQFFSQNPKTLKDLAHETGKIMGCCELAKIKYKMVAPTTWQSKVDLLGKKPKDISPYRWKKMKAKMIKEAAQGICYHEVADEDEGAAILIGYAMGGKDGNKNEFQFR